MLGCSDARMLRFCTSEGSGNSATLHVCTSALLQCRTAASLRANLRVCERICESAILRFCDYEGSRNSEILRFCDSQIPRFSDSQIPRFSNASLQVCNAALLQFWHSEGTRNSAIRRISDSAPLHRCNAATLQLCNSAIQSVLEILKVHEILRVCDFCNSAILRGFAKF